MRKSRGVDIPGGDAGRSDDLRIRQCHHGLEGEGRGHRADTRVDGACVSRRGDPPSGDVRRGSIEPRYKPYNTTIAIPPETSKEAARPVH
jgi:hypothetical protein